MTLDVDFVRQHFPGLNTDQILMDNAGGSQTLDIVMNRITEYLTHYDVQLGASYKTSAVAGEKCAEAHRDIAEYLNAARSEEVVMGASCTMVLRILSLCLSKSWVAGDEVIITNSEHEANASCWNDLKAQGIVVKVWKVNPDTLEFDIAALKALMTDRTKLVTMVHASNILGTINPIREVADAVHEVGALFCVDGVALAPHRMIDVQAWDVDFYAFSWYKVYGPHQGVLYGKYDLLKEMPGINHYFVDAIPYKFQPGNFNYELTYSIAGIGHYFQELYDHHFEDRDVPVRQKYERAFELVAAHEEMLANRLIDYLKTIPTIKIIGHATGDLEKRVATIAFVSENHKSDDVVEKVDAFNIGIRFGDFYAKQLTHDLGLEERNGVIRVSLVHYNTQQEVDKLIAALDTVLK